MTSTQLHSSCHNEVSSRLVILNDSDGAAGTFTTVFYNDNWIDAFRNVTSSKIFYSFNTVGYVISVTTLSLWDLSGTDDCFRFHSGGGGVEFRSHNCIDGVGKNLLCEIVL